MSPTTAVHAGPAARSDPNTVQSVRRAAALLDCFLEGRADRSLTELAGATGLSTSTAHRLLRTLADVELLWYNPESERYMPGPGLLRLARVVLDRDDVAGTRELLASLAFQTRLAVCLSVRDGAGARTVLLVEADGTSPARPDALPPAPLHASAAGKVLLAYTAAPVTESATSLGTLAAYTPATLVSTAALIDDLERIRTRAYAIEEFEYDVRRRAVAVPVRSGDGDVVAALGVSGGADAVAAGALPRLSRLLTATAGAISMPESLLPTASPPAPRRGLS
ncbi:IclR family transcriptional regulator [Frankia canadensis]|uniref:IclR family transcriptional regulator n=1 Tax=Frankia canadensis TaxID=1836972 RepID=UPI00140221F8|nr:IclR family transcriptional regulator [Frankia canadensis]